MEEGEGVGWVALKGEAVGLELRAKSKLLP